MKTRVVVALVPLKEINTRLQILCYFLCHTQLKTGTDEKTNSESTLGIQIKSDEALTGGGEGSGGLVVKEADLGPEANLT